MIKNFVIDSIIEDISFVVSGARGGWGERWQLGSCRSLKEQNWSLNTQTTSTQLEINKWAIFLLGQTVDLEIFYAIEKLAVKLLNIFMRDIYTCRFFKIKQN